MGSSPSSFLNAPGPSSIDNLTDEDIYELIRSRSKDNSIRPANDWNDLVVDTVWRISPDAVAKRTNSPTEAFIMSYVSSHTSIPIPKVRRIISDQPSNPDCRSRWIVMDYIDGDVLESAWRKMTLWRRILMIWTVRRYIRDLRKTPLPNLDVPGPFDDTGTSYLCTGHYFTEDGAGPFNSYVEMAAWFDRRRFDTRAAMHAETALMLQCPKFDVSHPLVLCHMDLHMRNMILDGDGRLWFIDWANAGTFPPWLEYAQMVLWGKAAREEARPPKFWTWSVRIMVGDYCKYATGYLDKLRWAFERPADDFFPLDYFEKRDVEVD